MLLKIGLYFAVGLIILETLLPIIWLIISSITTDKEMLSKPPHWIPDQPIFDRYSAILFNKKLTSAFGGDVNAPTELFLKSIWNSSIICLIVTVLSLYIGTIAAYAFSRLKFLFKDQFFILAVAVQMLPPIAIIIPMYFIINKLQLTDTYLALIVIYCSFTVTYVIWVMNGYFKTIPKELEDAARIDGCSRVGALYRVIIPISLPGLVATGILSFLTAWNEFMFALVFTNTDKSKTIPVAISEFSTQFTLNYGMMATGGILASIPPVLLAMFFQKYIIQGLTGGAVKG